MLLLIPVLRGRISPVLDVANNFLLLEIESGREKGRREVPLKEADLVERAKHMARLGAEVLICGAVSWPLEALLSSTGVRVIPNTCGPVEEVLAAFLGGRLTEQAFLMPGCRGRGWRHRVRHRGGRRF